jgi:RNase P/RNase MRP subunit p30
MELLLIDKEDAQHLSSRLDLSRSLGHRELLLLFTKHDRKNLELMSVLRKEHAGLMLRSGIFIRDQNQVRAMRKQYDAVVTPCRREFFETSAVMHILDCEDGNRPDFLHHRNSGLNQVLLALANKKGHVILSTLSQLLDAKHPEVPLGRMAQNARWCRKFKVPYHVVSGARTRWEQRGKEDLKALEREIRSS